MENKKNENKKLVSGLFISLVIMAIGAVLATAQTDTTTNETTTPIQNEGKHGPGPFGYNLTEGGQQTELEDLMATSESRIQQETKPNQQ